jgi:hypothetical protein
MAARFAFIGFIGLRTWISPDFLPGVELTAKNLLPRSFSGVFSTLHLIAMTAGF